MAIAPLDSALFGQLLSDPELAPVFSDARLVAEMIAVERALARAEGRLGVIPSAHAAAIDAALDGLAVDPAALAAGTAADGVPVPALVRVLREAVGGEAAQWVHFGATSQDILDTATLRQLDAALTILAGRLDRVIAALAALADRHRATIMIGRTRGQQAAPTSFGLKAAGWLAPLLRHRRRLAELRPRALAAGLGGAVGTLAALGDRGLAVATAFAEEVGLPAAPMPWHSQRDGIAEVAAWAAFVSGSLGKLAQDVILLAQNEVGEVREGSGGGSSTMPNKSNPVRAEAVLALARTNAGLLGQIGQALVHAHERDGAAWAQEWLALPQIMVGAGAALAGTERLLAGLVVDEARMAANLEATRGLVLAEAATFALAAHMPRTEAQALVRSACDDVSVSGRPLVAILRDRISAPVDWDRLADPRAAIGEAEALVDRVLAEVVR
ncbi:MAG: 3-carboxy-cis,cis-muconate cycloisomerase [Alphaproteobacteria bacterium]